MKALLAASAAIVLAGCAPSTVLELKDEATPVEFTTEKPYQRVFKDLKGELDRCIFGGFLMANARVDAQLYPDLGEGEISVRYNNMGDKSVFLLVEVLDQSQSTLVTAYPSTYGLWDQSGEQVRQFVVNDVPFCD